MTFRYIPIHRAMDYLRLGWLIVEELHLPHGEFSVLGRWLCDCKCIEPIKEG